MEIQTASKTDRQYKKLPTTIKFRAEEKEEFFVANPLDQRLGTHKLHGKDREHWAYWVTRKIRIKFLFLTNNSVLYLEIGTHDEVY